MTDKFISHYLAARLGVEECPAGLAPALHRRTDGHPLFLVTVVDALLQQGLLQEVDGQWTLAQALEVVEQEVPETLRHLIIQQFYALTAETRQLLEAASVAGLVAVVAEVAAALDADLETVEMQCAALGRTSQFLLPDGLEVWPDGTRLERYRFRHPLYQQVLYEQVSPTRRARLHRRIGQRQEKAYGARVEERAAVLAMHFERGHDVERAIHYRQRAVEQALRRYAYREAATHLSTALELLQTLPETSEQPRQELYLQMALGHALMATRGYGVPEAERLYTRALALSQQLGDTTQYVAALEALCRIAINRATLRTALARGAELLSLAQTSEAASGLLSAHQALGQTLYYLGEFTTARPHLELDTRALEAPQDHAGAAGSDVAVRVYRLVFAAQTCWSLGYATQARQHSHEAIVLG